MNLNLENKGVEKLKETFKEINQWEYENLHLDTLEEVIPSTRYKKRMDRLIRRQKQPCWKYVNTVGKRVAVFVLAIAITFVLSMSVAAVREPVVEFFVNVYEKFVEFFYGEDDIAKAPDTIETVYTLGYVPEGYELESCNLNKLYTTFVWTNDTGNRIVFSQGVLGAWNQLDNENSNYEILYMNDLSVAYIDKKYNQYYYWHAADYNFSLFVSDDIITQEIVAEIIESMLKYKK